MNQATKNAIRTDLASQIEYALENGYITGSFTTAQGGYATFEFTDLDNRFDNKVTGEIKIKVVGYGTETETFSGSESIVSLLMLMFGYIRNRKASTAYPKPIAPSAAFQALMPMFAEKRAAKKAKLIAEYNARKAK